MKKTRLIMCTGFISWFALAFFTFFNLHRIFKYACFFNYSWLSCDAHLTQRTTLFIFLLIIAVFLAFILYGSHMWSVYIGNTKKGAHHIKFFLPFILFFAFFVVPFGSGDMSYYFNVGRAVHGGINPYIENWTTGNAFGYPPVETKITGVMYGPVMLHVFNLFYSISQDSYITFIFLWKLLMLILFILCGWLLYRLITMISSGLEKRDFFFFWLLQPLFLFEWVSNGHFDALWIVLILLAIFFSLKKMWLFVWVCVMIGVWIKFIPALILPWFIIWWWQDVRNYPKRIIMGAVFGIISTIVISYISWFHFWSGFQVFSPILIQSKWAISSLFSVLYYSLSPLFNFFLSSNTHWYLTRLVHGVLLGIAFYLLFPLIKKFILVFLRKDHFDHIQMVQAIFLTLFVYLCIWQKSIWPWYMLWLTPFALILYLVSKNTLLGNVIGWLSISPLIYYIAWLPGWFINKSDASAKLWFFYVIFFVVLFYPLIQIFKWRKVSYR